MMTVTPQTSARSTARIVGVLFILATVAALISKALLDSVVNSSDYLATIDAHQGQLIAGAFFKIVAGFACAGIAMAFYPVLKERSPGLAIGSVGFRLMEGVMYVVGAVAVLLLIPLSQDFIAAGSPQPSYFDTTGDLLTSSRDLTGLAGVLAFYVGGSMYYDILYRSRLVPRWLSGWGLVSTALGAAAALLVLFRVVEPLSAPQVVLNLPLAVNEMVLAVWLIAKGFDSSAADPPAAKETAATASDELAAPRTS